MPADVLAGMRDTPHWEAMVSVAHTLTYDSLPGEWHGVPAQTLAPVLVEFLGASGA